MSFKAKNLSYEAQEPAFLRRLRGQQSGLDSDRHERPLARPRRAKVTDEDDAPTYVDEETNNTLSKDEYEALVAGDKVSNEAPTSIEQPKEDEERVAEPGEAATETIRIKQEVTEIGKTKKKRKAAKIVVADEEPEDDATHGKEQKKQKKIPKAVKLSFGTDEP